MDKQCFKCGEKATRKITFSSIDRKIIREWKKVKDICESCFSRVRKEVGY